MIKPETS